MQSHKRKTERRKSVQIGQIVKKVQFWIFAVRLRDVLGGDRHTYFFERIWEVFENLQRRFVLLCQTAAWIHGIASVAD